MPPRRAEAPQIIRRGGFEYEMTPASRWNRVLSEHRRRADEMAYPPPELLGVAPSPAQKVLLPRIAAAPAPLHWGGMLFSSNYDLRLAPYAPRVPEVSVRALYRKGMLRAVKLRGDDYNRMVLQVTERAARYLQPSRMAYETLRWRAVLQIAEELAEAHAAYRAAAQVQYQASKIGQPSPPLPDQPPVQARQRDIAARMRLLWAADRSPP